jgi:glycosyltransferase involved in cell wall biosynthesis
MDMDFTEDLVSLVLPTYNRSVFLQDAVSSIFDQTYRPIEVLVVDDGSTDDTKEIVRRLKEQADKKSQFELRYYYQENHGAPAARNLGLLKSEGEFIHFLDSDDILHPQAIETQIDVLRESANVDFVWTPIESFEGEDLPQPDNRAGEVASRIGEVRAPGTTSHPEAALYRRQASQRIGPWRERLERMQDWEYAFRITALRLRGAFLSEPYYYARTHAQESVGDVLYRPEGVSIDLRSLDAIEDTITASDDPSREMVYTAFRLYLKLLRRASRYGTHEEIEACFRGLERNSDKWARKMRVGTLQLVYRTFGARAMRFVTELYSQVQTGR